LSDQLPLSGLLVVALEQAVAAPFCSRQLADMGADVVKIERPEGDPARSYDSVLQGESAYFAWLNRGKRSVVLDLALGESRDALRRIIARADVFVHNLAPGAVERLGFGYEQLAPRQPRLVWCGISGYGPDGPRRDSKAYDMLVQAESGVVALTGTPNAAAKVGISIADIAAGLYAYASILTALLQRNRTGEGERIDISMLECLTEWVTPPLYVWRGTGEAPSRAGVRHNMIVPYGAYPCADGDVMFAVQHAAEWQRFCEGVLRQPELTDDPRFATNRGRLTNRAALEAIIEGRFRAHRRAEVNAWLTAAGIATGNVNDIEAVAQHPQLAARKRWTTVSSPSGEIPALIPPHNLQHALPRMGAVPALGEHTALVFSEFGIERASSETSL
jgi:crotonobetainyl-CoA:carnitine CoA-transferase CaiB-like acyl-CoA transferase